MSAFETIQLYAAPATVAPDGSTVRALLSLASGSVAHFELAPGGVTHPIVHRSVSEIWFVIAGSGEMWRRQGEREETIALGAGVCLTIPAGTHFQFRASRERPVAAIGMTMPAWPGDDEAVRVEGPWVASIG